MVNMYKNLIIPNSEHNLEIDGMPFYIDDWDITYAVLSSDFNKLLNKAIECIEFLISSIKTSRKWLEKSLVEKWNILLKKLSNYKNGGVDGRKTAENTMGAGLPRHMPYFKQKRACSQTRY